MTETYQPLPPTTDRKKRLWLPLGVVVAVAVAAFVAVYLLFFTGDSPDRLTLSTPSTTATGGAQTQDGAAPTGNDLVGTWTVAPDSTVGYRVREKLARLPAQSEAVGRTNSVTGSIQVNRQGSQFVVPAGARFDADVSTLKSEEQGRDNRIRTMGLESNKFPTATFVSTAPITLPATAVTGQINTEVVGDLTIHGVTKRVTIPLQVQFSGGRIETVGSLGFPFSDFGMTAPSIAGVVTVDDNVTLEFQLLFAKG